MKKVKSNPDVYHPWGIHRRSFITKPLSPKRTEIAWNCRRRAWLWEKNETTPIPRLHGSPETEKERRKKEGHWTLDMHLNSPLLLHSCNACAIASTDSIGSSLAIDSRLCAYSCPGFMATSSEAPCLCSFSFWSIWGFFQWKWFHAMASCWAGTPSHKPPGPLVPWGKRRLVRERVEARCPVRARDYTFGVTMFFPRVPERSDDGIDDSIQFVAMACDDRRAETGRHSEE